MLELWTATEKSGEVATSQLGRSLAEAFAGSREEALLAAALLRALCRTGALGEVLEELSQHADGRAVHAGLGRATLSRLAGEVPQLAEQIEACQARWAVPEADRFSGMSLDELLAKNWRRDQEPSALHEVVRRCQDENVRAELETSLRVALRAAKARDVDNALRNTTEVARAGVRLTLEAELERLANKKGPEARKERALRALEALARRKPVLSVNEAIAACRDQPKESFAYAYGVVSLEQHGRDGELGAQLATVVELHPLAVELHVIATGDAAGYFSLPADYNGSDGARQLFRHIEASLTAGKSPRLPLFPELSERDLAQTSALSLHTQRLALVLGPGQYIGDRAIAWLATRTRDEAPGSYGGGTWRAWASQTTISELAIRTLARAAEHPDAAAARKHLQELLDERAPISSMAARALATCAAVRGDLVLLKSLLSHPRAHVREHALEGASFGYVTFAHELAGKEQGRVRDNVPIALIEPSLRDRSKPVAALAAKVCAEYGAKQLPGALPKLPLAKTIQSLRSGNYSAARHAQQQVVELARQGYSAEELARFVGPVADSMGTSSSFGEAALALSEAGVDLRKLVPAFAAALAVEDMGPKERKALLVCANLEAAAALDLVIAPLLSSSLASHYKADYLHYLEARRLAGHPPARTVPVALFAEDSTGALAVSALGPENWQGSGS